MKGPPEVSFLKSILVQAKGTRGVATNRDISEVLYISFSKYICFVLAGLASVGNVAGEHADPRVR